MQGLIKDILWISIVVGILGLTMVILSHYYNIHNVMDYWWPLP